MGYPVRLATGDRPVHYLLDYGWLIMYTYRIVLDAYDSRSNARSARVVTYSQGYDRTDALRKIGSVRIASDGTVSDGLSSWPGTRNMPRGPVQERSLPEYYLVSIRTVPAAGKARILVE